MEMHALLCCGIYILLYSIHSVHCQNDPVLITNLPIGAPITIAEDTPLGNSVYQVSFSDSDAGDTHTFIMTSAPTEGQTYFDIDSTGYITTAGQILDLEALNSSTITLIITVSDSASASDTQILQVQVTNINEMPVFAQNDYSLSAIEGNALTVIGTPNFTVTDPDIGDSLTYTMDCGASNGRFLMNTITGAISYQSDYDLDTGSLPTTISCLATVTDVGGLFDTATLTLYIGLANDNTPIFSPSSYSFFISFYSVTGTSVGTVTASDADVGSDGNITLTLDQASIGTEPFTITSSGVITLQVDPTVISNGLNYSSTYTILAIATDDGGLIGTGTVTIVTSITTTTVPTTTTYKYKKFADNPKNVAWLIPCILLLLVTIGVTGWIVYTCRGRQGCQRCLRNFFREDDLIRKEPVRRPRQPVRFETWRNYDF